MNEKSKLAPADYRQVWDSIRPGVEAAIKHQREGLRVEDVYCSLKLGEAYLFTCPTGFIIVREQLVGGLEKDLLVWLAYGQANDGRPVIESYQDQVEEIGRKSGCAGLQLTTCRPGMSKQLPALGWKLMHERWRKAL